MLEHYGRQEKNQKNFDIVWFFGCSKCSLKTHFDMKKIRQKRMKSVIKQIGIHEGKIRNEKGRKDTTKDYWKKEIDEKFLKQLEEDTTYLEEHK